MSRPDKGHDSSATADGAESKVRRRVHRLVLAGTLIAMGALPAVAQAHGATDPVATSYLARIARVPAGLEAKVVDGDLRLWLRAAPGVSVVVLDYRGAPYLRFSRSGVEVNVNSAMYYLNLTPVETPPSRVSPTIPPRWQEASSGHEYSWHDGRLQALASIAHAPGSRYVGRWSIPMLIGGRLNPISGGLFYAPDPPIVWFWPIVVLLVCTLAAWRVRRPAIDARVVRGLAAADLVAIATAGAGRELHGRPTVSVFQLVSLAFTLAFVAWGVRRVVLQRLGYFAIFLIAIVALWEGTQLLPTLLQGFVLAAGPAFVVRGGAVLCLGCGAGLLVFTFRWTEQREPGSSDDDEWSDDYDFEDAGARESRS